MSEDPDDGWIDGDFAGTNPHGRASTLREIETKLRAAKVTYDRARRPEDRRAAVGYAICAAVELICRQDAWRLDGLDYPLRDVLSGLMSLDVGAVEPILQPGAGGKRRKGKPSTIRDLRFRGSVAAALHVRLFEGAELESAAEWVASHLRAAGHRKAGRNRYDGAEIRSDTVKGWLKEARERASSNGDPLGAVYSTLVNAFERGQPGARSHEILAQALRRMPPEK